MARVNLSIKGRTAISAAAKVQRVYRRAAADSRAAPIRAAAYVGASGGKGSTGRV